MTRRRTLAETADAIVALLPKPKRSRAFKAIHLAICRDGAVMNVLRKEVVEARRKIDSLQYHLQAANVPREWDEKELADFRAEIAAVRAELQAVPGVTTTEAAKAMRERAETAEAALAKMRADQPREMKWAFTLENKP
jgi:hypothetical protein